ncbi:MAG: hypothetical protein M3Q78_05185 [Acidobacteriota bacterium]|nr:hypothetical protein [Acidobacteriota bacterium]
MKLLFIISMFVMLLGISVFGQNQAKKSAVCTEETARKISSRGINIGANVKDVINLFALTEAEKQRLLRSSSGSDNDRIGYKFFSISPDPNPQPPNENLVGISDYTFSFLDKGLTGFTIFYNKPVWENTEQFTVKMAETFALPDIKSWNSEPDGTLWLQCGNYKITTQTFNFGRSSIGIYDNRIRQILEQRKRKAANE